MSNEKIILLDFLELEVRLIEYKKNITHPIIIKEYNELLVLYRRYMSCLALNARVLQMLFNNHARMLIKQKKWDKISELLEGYEDIRDVWNKVIIKMKKIKEMQNDVS